MSPRHTYFRFTTAQQRKLLFETWERTSSVEEACRKAVVSLRLFYYWKPRFEEKGYAGLEGFESRVAHKLNRKAVVAQQVMARRWRFDHFVGRVYTRVQPSSRPANSRFIAR